ncbi:MAG: hypothetical protein RO257_10075 [Candidatus Kapabacteria bacterium]|nr:hypothetical protein [Candidatus Kapabacteria bacterium]
MFENHISISKSAQKRLTLLSSQLGKNENEIANLAILNYNYEKEIPIRELLKKAKGMWTDRIDLPDYNKIRKSWEREFND